MKPGRYYHRLTDLEKKKIIKLSQQGIRNVDIAVRFGVTPETVGKIIRKLKETA